MVNVLRGFLFGIAGVSMLVAVAGIAYGLLLLYTRDREGWIVLGIGVIVVLLGLLLFKTARTPS